MSSHLELPFTDAGAIPGSASGAEVGSHHPESSQPIRETRAKLKLATGQTPIRFQGQVLGFMEEFGASREGLLRLEPEALSFQPDATRGEDRWPLDRIRSVQASSSSVQITTHERGLVSIKVQGESIRLWELLIHQAIQAVWSARGWGRIVEFQPRIRAE
ncbi:MAG: hypothetical protein EA422_08535 [Gemmatimonadales bacterium]|nr:MAG: hypothetical protein EA422_08535 [Gemmatimonadales bacterium]